MSSIITVDRTIPFTPVIIGRRDFSIIEESNCPSGPLDLDSVLLVSFEIGRKWEGCLKNHLDSNAALAIFKEQDQPGLIPDRWKEKIDGEPRYIFFCGTPMCYSRDYYQPLIYVVILYWQDEVLHMSYNYQNSYTWPRRKFAAMIA